MTTKKLQLILIFSAVLFCAPFSAQAFNVKIAPKESRIYSTGEEVALDLTIEAIAGEKINALDLSVPLPEGMRFVRSSDTGSIISLWVDRPFEKDGSVALSGIAPGGFDGIIDPVYASDAFKRSPVFVATIFVVADNAGTYTLSPFNTRGYLHDGNGTEIIGTSTSAKVIVDEKTIGRPTTPDILPPLPFTITLVRDPLLYDGAPTILFSTKDNQSGLAYYEITETGMKSMRGESPYKLLGPARGVVKVTAFDNAGNKRTESLVLSIIPRSVSLLVVSGLSLLSLIWFIIRRWARKKILYLFLLPFIFATGAYTVHAESLSAIEIFSDTHPSENIWYASSVAHLSWSLPEGATAVRESFNQEKDSVPLEESYLATEARFDTVPEGTSYFHLQAKTGELWSPVSTYRVQSDRTNPVVKLSLPHDIPPGEKSGRVVIDTSDAYSGVRSISVALDGGEKIAWQDPGTHVYVTGVLGSGSHTIHVEVVDMAGNTELEDFSFTTPFGKSSLSFTDSSKNQESALRLSIREILGDISMDVIFAILWACLLLVMVILIWHRRKYGKGGIFVDGVHKKSFRKIENDKQITTVPVKRAKTAIGKSIVVEEIKDEKPHRRSVESRVRHIKKTLKKR